MFDNIRKGLVTRRRSKTATGKTSLNGGIIEIPLDFSWLVKEHRIFVQVAQAFTNAPTGYDVRRFFKRIQLVVDKGDGIKLNFPLLYDLGRFTESSVSPVVTLAAAAKAAFSFELHHEMHGAINGFITSMLSGKYTDLKLQIQLAADADNGFTGGTVPLEAAYTVEVYPIEYRTMTPADRGDQSGGWGCADHSTIQLSDITGGVAGFDQEVSLRSGNKTRFLILHAYDAASAGALTNAVFRNGATISMNIDGRVVYDNTSLAFLQDENTSERGFTSAGVLVLDAGDDPYGWWDLRNVKEQKFKLTIPASANLPAAWRIEMGQDFVVGLNDSRIPQLLRA